MSKMFVLLGCTGPYYDKRSKILAVSTNRETLEKAIDLCRKARQVDQDWLKACNRFYGDNYNSVVPTIPTPAYISKNHLSYDPESRKIRQETNKKNTALKNEYLRKLHDIQKEPIAQLEEAAKEYANKLHPERATLVEQAISLHEKYEIDEVPIL
jgi:hypothetical protein